MPLPKLSSATVIPLIALFILAGAVAGCGGGSGGSDSDEDDRPTPVLPGLTILSVTSIGQGDEIDVELQLSASTAGVAPASVFLANSIVSPAAAGITFRNIVTSSTTGMPVGNGVLNIVPPAAGDLVIGLSISSRTTDLLPVATGNELTIFVSDGVQVSESTALFDVTLQMGLLNEPTCSVAAPLGGTLSGDVPVQITVVDFESDPIDGTLSYSLDGGLSFSPCTLEPSSSPFLGAYTPTNPANTFAGPANQFVDATTPTVDVVWLTDVDIPGAFSRQRVTLAISVEDGTTMGVGPFSTCQSRFFVDNSPPPSSVSTPALIVSHGKPAVVDPQGVLDSSELPIGATGDLVLSGLDFTPGDLFTLSSAGGVASTSIQVMSNLRAVGSVRATPDGPVGSLDDSAQFAAIGSVLIMRNGAFFSSFAVVDAGSLISLSTDEFTVAPGGTFHLAVQVPSAVGVSPTAAYGAVIHYDEGALDMVEVLGGSNADFSAPPQTKFSSPPSGLALLTVFQDPVPSRTDLTGPAANVASVEMRVSEGVLPGTIIHLWMETDDSDNVVLTEGGGLLFVSTGLGVLGTSILVQ